MTDTATAPSSEDPPQKLTKGGKKSAARKRLRDWPITVFLVDLHEVEIPEELYIQHRKMCAYWNQLCEGHAQIRAEIEALYLAAVAGVAFADEAAEKKARDAWYKANKPVTTALWKKWDKETIPQLEKAAGLNWNCGPDVTDRFRKSWRMHSQYPELFGWPKVGSTRRVSIPHRYSGGGATVLSLSSAKSKRFWLSQHLFDSQPIVDARGRMKFRDGPRVVEGLFGLDNGAQFVIKRAVIDQAIPHDAFIKSVKLLGQRVPGFDEYDDDWKCHPAWEWKIAITAEVPPTPYDRESTGRTAAIDMGWRKRETGWRVAYVKDEGAGYEILLPYEFSNNRIRRFNQRFVAGSPDRYRIPTTYTELFALRSERDTRRHELVVHLKTLMSPIPPGLDNMRERGFARLLRGWTDRETELEHPPLPLGPARDAIVKFLRWDAPRRFTETRAHLRFVKARDWRYKNIAKQLALQYDEIIVEDLNIKRMAEQSDAEKGHVLAAADRSRQIAAPATFLQYLERACVNYRSKFTKKSAVNSTAICSICGEPVATGPKLLLTCANGHVEDQDRNAATNLAKPDWPLPSETRPTAGQPV